MASGAGPITPTDGQIHSLASKVVYIGLQELHAILSSERGAWNYDKIGVLCEVVRAGTEGMLPPDDKSLEFED